MKPTNVAGAVRSKGIIVLCGIVVSCAILGPVGTSAQEPDDATRILSLDEKVEICTGNEGLERTVCLANLASTYRSGKPCDADPTGECGRLTGTFAIRDCARSARTDEERIPCEMAAAVEYKSADSCSAALKGDLCLTLVASETRNPNVILDGIEDRKRRDEALASYASSTGDSSTIDRIEDNYSADAALIMSNVTRAARSGDQAGNAFCWNDLRGGYKERDGYTESLEDTRKLCFAAMNLSNAVNAQRGTVETPQDADALAKKLEALLKAVERREISVDDLAGLPPEDPAAVEASAYRESADRALSRCDFVGALDDATAMRSLDPHHPWLIANFDSVSARARRQTQFRTLMEAADDIVGQALDSLDPASLGAAADLVRNAARFADAGCPAESDEVVAALQRIEDYREAILGEIGTETADDNSFADTRARSADAGWSDGQGTVREIDPCSGFEASFRAADAALTAGDLTEWSTYLMPALQAGCRSDEALRQVEAAVAEISRRSGLEAQAADAVGRQHMSSPVSALESSLTAILTGWNASQAGAPVETADETLARIYGTRRAPAREVTGGAAVNPVTSVAGSGAAHPGCSLGVFPLKPDPARGRTFFVVRQDNGSVLVTSWPSPLTEAERRECGTELGCVKAVMLDRAPGGYTIVGTSSSESAAEAMARRECPSPL